MQLMYREYLSIAVLFGRQYTPFGHVHTVVDWPGHQTIWFIHLRWCYLVIMASHRSPWWQLFDSVRDDANCAALELYYEQCGWSQTEGKTFAQEQAAVWRRTFVRSLYSSLRNRAVCKVRGHQTESYADAENGTEDVYCTRCGWGFHAQF